MFSSFYMSSGTFQSKSVCVSALRFVSSSGVSMLSSISQVSWVSLFTSSETSYTSSSSLSLCKDSSNFYFFFSSIKVVKSGYILRLVEFNEDSDVKQLSGAFSSQHGSLETVMQKAGGLSPSQAVYWEQTENMMAAMTANTMTMNPQVPKHINTFFLISALCHFMKSSSQSMQTLCCNDSFASTSTLLLPLFTLVFLLLLAGIFNIWTLHIFFLQP